MKRTFKAKAVFLPFSLLSKKKLKCLICGKYNKSTHAQPFSPDVEVPWHRKSVGTLLSPPNDPSTPWYRKSTVREIFNQK
jgi:hypothetical protein